MAGHDRFSQYEVWAPAVDRWEMVASFREFNVAYAVASTHGGHVRLLQVTYEGGKPLQEDLLAELGLAPELRPEA